MKDLRVPIEWIAERLGKSPEHIAFLLRKQLKADEQGKYVRGFDFFQWVFRYRPPVWTEQHRSFVEECHLILYNAMKGISIPKFQINNN